MKAIILRLTVFICLAGWLGNKTARAQIPPTLGLQLYAGLSITGAVGGVYTVQYTADVSQSNSWTSLAFVQLPTSNYLFLDTTAPATGRRFYRALLQNAPTNLVFIPANTFNLGSPANELLRSTNEGPQTVVTLTHSFWMGKFEVTQRDYLALTGSNPSSFNTDSNLPVESVSWPEATNYCALLTQQELVAGHIPPGSHFRLPTEAEWEYAARAGSSTRFYYGDDAASADLASHAWFANNSGIKTHPVGQKLPNAWGLFDMEGNVLEWTQDWLAPYPGGFAVDPQGAPDGTDKVIRGGTFDSPDTDCRSARRQFFAVSPFLKDFTIGFRVVLVTGQP